MKIFLIIALFFASSLQFLLDYVWPEKNKPTRYKIIRGLLFILILIVFIASITTEVRDEKEKGELKELAGKSITLLTENKKIATDNKHLNEKIAFKNEEIAILSKKIVDKSGQIEKLNQNISSNVTGGDAYCYLEPSIDPIRGHAPPPARNRRLRADNPACASAGTPSTWQSCLYSVSASKPENRGPVPARRGCRPSPFGGPPTVCDRPRLAATT